MGIHVVYMAEVAVCSYKGQKAEPGCKVAEEDACDLLMADHMVADDIQAVQA